MEGGTIITKYIKVKVNLEKTIPIENDDISKAVELAKEQFYNEELSEEWLDYRDVSFEENEIILYMANCLARSLFNIYGNDITLNDVKADLDLLLKPSDEANYIFDETINVLNEKYDLGLSKIKI